MSKVKVDLKTFNALKSMEELYGEYGELEKKKILKSKISNSFLSLRSCLNEIDMDTFLQILVNGYELEETKEEKLLKEYNEKLQTYKLFDDANSYSYCQGIKFALDMTDQKVKGINE